ncbi:hypothetical protein A5647_03895 [Mycobacterium sp. 1100029.7]|nr:hypothetical protein A5647_03895 [Mycobacterium sp. 1100029.7]
MPTIWTYAKAAAVVVGSSAALLTGGIAHADPAPIPDPVQNIPQQLIASAANAPQILQNLATALGAQPPQAPPTPGITFPGMTSAQAPAASSPAAVPSIPGLSPASAPTAPTAASPTIPGLSSIPGLGQTTPAAPAAPAAPASAIPGLGSIPGLGGPAATAPAAPASAPQVANVNMPALPGLPLNVPPKLSLPGDLTSLAAGAVPGAPAAPAAPAAPSALTPPSLLSAIP